MHSNNIDNNTTNKENNSKELLPKSDFQFGKAKPKKDNLYTKCSSMINDYTDDGELRKALHDYLRIRLEMKERPLYLGVWKGLLNKLQRDFDYNEDRLASVRQSIERGYASFFPVNKGSYGALQYESGARNVPVMTKEDYEREAQRLAELEAKGVQVKF